MNKDLIKEADDELIVIPDECGDSLWDVVLAQEFKPVEENKAAGVQESLLHRINTVQVCDATKVEKIFSAWLKK